MESFAVCGNLWQELASWAFLCNVVGGVAFVLTEEAGLPASVSDRVCPLEGEKLPVVHYRVREMGVKISIAKFTMKIQEFERRNHVRLCMLHKQQEQQKIAPVLTDEKAVKHNSKIMSCPALPSPKANKSLEIKMFPLIFKSLHGLQL